eukprot:366501-Chlamydomonas_euryale.AAC.15
MTVSSPLCQQMCCCMVTCAGLSPAALAASHLLHYYIKNPSAFQLSCPFCQRFLLKLSDRDMEIRVLQARAATAEGGDAAGQIARQKVRVLEERIVQLSNHQQAEEAARHSAAPATSSSHASLSEKQPCGAVRHEVCMATTLARPALTLQSSGCSTLIESDTHVATGAMANSAKRVQTRTSKWEEVAKAQEKITTLEDKLGIVSPLRTESHDQDLT